MERLIEHITTGLMIDLDDETHEDHRIIDTRDSAELRNLAQWILSL